MFAHLLSAVRQTARRRAQALGRRLAAATIPVASPLVGGTLADVVRSKPTLIAENVLLRQQSIILRRSVQRPHCTPADRPLLVLLASRVRLWRQALPMPAQQGVRLDDQQGLAPVLAEEGAGGDVPRKAKVSVETIALIREMAAATRLWGAERIRGELLNVNIRVATWTIQKYRRGACPPRRSGQTGATFLQTQASGIWACDFLPVTDLLFRQVYAFFSVELATRRVMHVAVTRHPTDAWVAQQLREATPFGHHPTSLIRDNDSTFGPAFPRVAEDSGIEILRTAYRAPTMTAVCARGLGSVRRECLDHLLILGEAHLRRALRADVTCFKGARPHQGSDQQVPEGVPGSSGPIVATPVLGGLHHAYQRVA